MKTVKISQEQMNAIADHKSPWLVVQYDVVIKVCKNREEARADKRVILDSEIGKVADYDLKIAGDKIENQLPPAPIGEEIKGDVHDYRCPHCGIALENGVGDHVMDVNGKNKVMTKQYEHWCMACEGEFGPAVKPATPKAPKAKTDRKVEQVSTIANPCKTVWAIAIEMKKANPNVKRAEILKACEEAGIAYYTARTQYQQWLTTERESAAEAAARDAAK